MTQMAVFSRRTGPGTIFESPLSRTLHLHMFTRHENFHGKFRLCAEYLIRSIGQMFTCRLKCSQTIQR